MRFYNNGKVYVCKLRLLGFSFATLDKEDAQKWVDEDIESRYFEEIDLMIGEV